MALLTKSQEPVLPVRATQEALMKKKKRIMEKRKIMMTTKTRKITKKKIMQTRRRRRRKIMQIMKRSDSIRAKGTKRITSTPLATMQRAIPIPRTKARTLLFIPALMEANLKQNIQVPETAKVPEGDQVSEAALVSEGVPGRGIRLG